MFGNLTNSRGLFDQFQQMQRDLDSLFDLGAEPASIRAVAHGSYPPINVGTTPETVEVYVFAAGLEKESLDVSIQQNLLTIGGARKAAESEKDERSGSYLNERFTGNFKRVLSLPEDVDPERIDASYRDGILHITVHKKEAVKPRQIAVEIE